MLRTKHSPRAPPLARPGSPCAPSYAPVTLPYAARDGALRRSGSEPRKSVPLRGIDGSVRYSLAFHPRHLACTPHNRPLILHPCLCVSNSSVMPLLGVLLPLSASARGSSDDAFLLCRLFSAFVRLALLFVTARFGPAKSEVFIGARWIFHSRWLSAFRSTTVPRSHKRSRA